jgi:hypothetical protein
MKGALISATALAFLLAWTQPPSTQDLASQLVGVWKFTSQSTKEVATGEKPTGHFDTRRADTLLTNLSRLGCDDQGTMGL